MYKSKDFIYDKVDLFNRLALCIIFYWFGILKLLSLSPAEPLVRDLYLKTIHSLVPFDYFLIFLGLLECIIGILFLCPRYTKIAFTVFSIQIVTTLLPLFVLPQEVWHNGIAPTLTGQYIIKNVVLMGCALSILKYWNSNLKNQINYSTKN
ncbi:MAG: hypothetical protein IPK88_02415 [Saprospiraceae bacterium]|jgi:uncharacterized membrane protein YkgB|nr:hypothetical protein [Candidatus Defluviibacterium haderslevense]MCC7028020.1 hypothetical protein [Saprospiraceae bacterium]